MASLTTDIFSLEQVYFFQNFGDWIVVNQFGYFGGGTPGPSSLVDRIDFSNDTATALVRGSLSSGRTDAAATGNGGSGYFGGGLPGPLSSTDRIDYSNDTATASPKGKLSVARQILGASGNSSYGYFGGGYVAPSSSVVDRLDYTNDTATAAPKGPLSAARQGVTATGNQSYGYFAGGYTPGSLYRSIVDRIDYSNDTATAAAKGPLTAPRWAIAATGNSSYGYFSGGYGPTAPNTKSIIDRIDYSNDTATALPRGPLSVANQRAGATGNSSYGYFGGGNPSPYSLVDRLDYSNDTATASPRGPLTVARYGLSAVSGREYGLPDFGYNLLTPNSPDQYLPPVNYGYFGGGATPVRTSTIDRIDYTNDTATLKSKATLSSDIYESGATGNSFYGYYGGGNPTGPGVPTPISSKVDRIDYSNDTATALVRGPLTSAIRQLTATGNSSYGYFGGGYAPGGGLARSRVDRVDYSDDTATAVTKGPLNFSVNKLAATGNSSYGYFGGGYFPSLYGGPAASSAVDRVDYSNDTATASPKGALSVARYYLSATGNASFGYFGGGYFPGGGFATSQVDRVDYSNDTATAAPKGPLSIARYALSATGNSSFGYFGGGATAPVTFTSAVDRVDYSNDTATASPKGPLTVAKFSLAATSAAANGLPQ